MFLVYLVASWLATICLAVVIRKQVANYEERQIASGECASPTKRPRGISVKKTQSFADSSITSRELAALKKTPVFQLWAENKSRSLTRLQLGHAQKRFWLKIIAYIALVLAVSVVPYDATMADGVQWALGSNSSRVVLPRTLTGLSHAYDVRTKGPSVLLNILGLPFSASGTIGPHQLVWGVLGPVLMLVGGVMLLLVDWQQIKALVKNSQSLVSFMATTDHDPNDLALRMNKTAIGDFDEAKGRHRLITKVARALLVVGLLAIRFGPIAVNAFSQGHSQYARWHQHLAEPITGTCVGFMLASVAALALVCA